MRFIEPTAEEKSKHKLKSKNKLDGCEFSFISSGSVSFCHI